MNGIYGTVKPSSLDSSNIERDVEMFYYYRPTRNLTSDDFKEFQTLSTSYLVPNTCGGNTLFGMYTLKLPVDKFNRKGFYTIYIRPKEYVTTLYDVSVLAAYPNVRGVVINTSSLGVTDLTGYRIEFLNGTTGVQKTDESRLITSCNRCVPTAVSVVDSYPKAVRYKLVSDSSSNYVFCTVTPSTSPSYNTNSLPYIGEAGKRVVLVNTKFNPVMLEVEMVEHDDDTISYMLEGDQVRDRDNAIITTYNTDHDIYHQADYYTIKDKLANPLYDVKQTRENIDGTQLYDNVINGNS